MSISIKIFYEDNQGAFKILKRNFETFWYIGEQLNILRPIKNNWDMEFSRIYDFTQMVQTEPNIIIGLRQLSLHFFLNLKRFAHKSYIDI